MLVYSNNNILNCKSVNFNSKNTIVLGNKVIVNSVGFTLFAYKPCLSDRNQRCVSEFNAIGICATF